MADDKDTHNPKSLLVAALAMRERASVEFDLSGFLGLAGKPVEKVRMRVATKTEIDRAIVAAHRYVADKTAGNGAAAADPDILLDNKTLYILHQVCRDAAQPNVFSAFPSPGWMRDNLTTYQIGVLLNYYNDVVRQTQPVESTLDGDRLEAIASMCATYADTDTPNLALMTFSREQLGEIVVRLSARLHEERAALAAPAASAPAPAQ